MNLKIRFLIKVCFFSVLSIVIASAMDVDENLDHPPKKRFVDAHFVIPSQSAYTFLFHENDWQELYQSTRSLAKGFKSAVIVGLQSEIAGVTLKQINNEELFYKCLDDENDYEDLPDILNYLAASYRSGHIFEKEDLFLNPGKSNPVSLDHVVTEIQESDTVCIAFGCGVSRSRIPTLIDTFEALGLKKLPTKDNATDETHFAFIARLVNNKEETLELMRRAWEPVVAFKVSTTPAHQVLKNIIEFLKRDGKDTYAFTDNKDGIHLEVGIQLSVKSNKLEDAHSPLDIVFPSLHHIVGKKVTVLVCGQSFDYNYVLSTINTRAQGAAKVTYVSFNINQDSIGIYKGLDFGELSQGLEGIMDISKFPVTPLDMLFIEGPAEKTLPELLCALVKARSLPFERGI